MDILIIIVGAAILIWQTTLTFLFVRVTNRHKELARLEEGSSQRNLIAKLNERIALVEKKELEHIQKIKIERFNPFNETGGDNSFTLGLLNAKLDGVVLTGLHTREKTRMYAKEIKEGKSKHELSKEEKKVIEEAYEYKK
jgi:hypothetical protein